MIIGCKEKLKEKEMKCDSLVANQSTSQAGKNISVFQQCQKRVKDSDTLIKAKEKILKEKMKKERKRVVNCIQKLWLKWIMDDRKVKYNDCSRIHDTFFYCVLRKKIVKKLLRSFNHQMKILIKQFKTLRERKEVQSTLRKQQCK